MRAGESLDGRLPSQDDAPRIPKNHVTSNQTEVQPNEPNEPNEDSHAPENTPVWLSLTTGLSQIDLNDLGDHDSEDDT